MAKVNDGKVYSLLMGSKCGYDKRNGRTTDVYYRYVELAANNPDRRMDFYNKEIYAEDGPSYLRPVWSISAAA